MACSLCTSAPRRLRCGSEASAASRKTTMWPSAALSDWSIQSMLPDMWQALRVTSTRWLTERRRAVALKRNKKIKGIWIIAIIPKKLSKWSNNLEGVCWSGELMVVTAHNGLHKLCIKFDQMLSCCDTWYLYYCHYLCMYQRLIHFR